MATRKVPFNEKGIGKLPEDKPVLYRIQTKGGKLNYAGIAKRGRIQERLQEHLGEIPGASVRIDQFPTVQDAKTTEKRVIKRNDPKYNQRGK